MAARSAIWTSFLPIGQGVARCNRCPQIVRMSGGRTCNLWRHVRRFHSADDEKKAVMEERGSLVPSRDEDTVKKHEVLGNKYSEGSEEKILVDTGEEEVLDFSTQEGRSLNMQLREGSMFPTRRQEVEEEITAKEAGCAIRHKRHHAPPFGDRKKVFREKAGRTVLTSTILHDTEKSIETRINRSGKDESAERSFKIYGADDGMCIRDGEEKEEEEESKIFRDFDKPAYRNCSDEASYPLSSIDVIC